MTFNEVYQRLCVGDPIKRADWIGYWVREGDDVVMYCKDGSIVSMKEGCNPMFTLSHCCANDWIVVSEEHRKELDAIHRSLVLSKPSQNVVSD